MATPHRLRHHVGVFGGVPAYMHEAMVAACVRDATFAPMDDETLAPYLAPWLGAEGQEAFYRQIAQNDPRHADEVRALYGGIERPVLILWARRTGGYPRSGADGCTRPYPVCVWRRYPAARTYPRRMQPPL